MTEEKFLMRLIDGPDAGTRIHPGPWPLPEIFKVPASHGAYVKVSQSQIRDDDMKTLTFVMRGAEYAWRDDAEVTS